MGNHFEGLPLSGEASASRELFRSLLEHVHVPCASYVLQIEVVLAVGTDKLVSVIQRKIHNQYLFLFSMV